MNDADTKNAATKFAATVLAAAAKVQGAGRWSERKVFISELAKACDNAGLTAAGFRRWLLIAQQYGLLQLARADLVGAMDPDLVAASELKDRFGEFHFVIT